MPLTKNITKNTSSNLNIEKYYKFPKKISKHYLNNLYNTLTMYNIEIIKDIPTKLLNNKHFILKFSQKNPSIIKYASTRIRNNDIFIIKLLTQYSHICEYNICIYFNLPTHLKYDNEIIRLMIQNKFHTPEILLQILPHDSSIKFYIIFLIILHKYFEFTLQKEFNYFWDYIETYSHEFNNILPLYQYFDTLLLYYNSLINDNIFIINICNINSYNIQFINNEIKIKYIKQNNTFISYLKQFDTTFNLKYIYEFI
jgi:hypothetical protein